MCLGVDLFNEMMSNYKHSMPKKRKHFLTKKGQLALAREIQKRDGVIRFKFNPTKEELERLVWEKPSNQIAKENGVTSSVISHRCQKFGIQKPPKGYWQKKWANEKKLRKGQ